MEEMLIATPQDLAALGERVLRDVGSPRAKRAGAAVLALHGELGAGKTAFTQQLARLLGVAESVTSPTFVIMRSYRINTHDFFTKLVHVDAYRIESLEELDPIGFAAVLAEPKQLVCVEWAERIGAVLPEDTFHITFSHGSGTFRDVVYGYGT